jgi:hypothetical protein
MSKQSFYRLVSAAVLLLTVAIAGTVQVLAQAQEAAARYQDSFVTPMVRR